MSSEDPSPTANITEPPTQKTPLVERRAKERTSATALATVDKTGRQLKIFAFVGLVYAIVVVTVASLVGVYNSFQAREEAHQGAVYAELALKQAEKNGDIAVGITAILDTLKPCEEGDPPTKPACLEKVEAQKRLEHAITEVSNALAGGIADHDLNATNQHEAIRRGAPFPQRTPITAPERTTTTSRSVQAPRTTTTTCPKLPNGKCRPN